MTDRLDPAYGESCLSDLAPWLRAALGVGGVDDLAPGLGSPPDLERIVLLVFDGLGSEQIERYRSHCPFISRMEGVSITSTFPSTTGAGLTSLSTGLTPGRHGIVGYVFESGGGAFNVVKYSLNGRDARTVLEPEDLQPEQTMFEIGNERGLTTWVVAADGFRASGFTMVFLRGGRWHGWKKPEEMPEIVNEVIGIGARSLVYAYYDGIDQAAHESGLGSERYLDALKTSDRIASEIASGLAPRSAMLLTADHGMVDVPPESREFIDPEIDSLCRLVGGEGRCRYLYAHPGQGEELEASAARRWSEWAWVMSKTDAVEAGLFGAEPTAASLGRIGDVVVAAREPKALFRQSRNRFIPLANHGSLTSAEMSVPMRLAFG